MKSYRFIKLFLLALAMSSGTAHAEDATTVAPQQRVQQMEQRFNDRQAKQVEKFSERKAKVESRIEQRAQTKEDHQDLIESLQKERADYRTEEKAEVQQKRIELKQKLTDFRETHKKAVPAAPATAQ